MTRGRRGRREEREGGCILRAMRSIVIACVLLLFVAVGPASAQELTIPPAIDPPPTDSR